MRFLVITLNASVDTTYMLDRLNRGAVTRVPRKVAVPGGKGNNVAKVLAYLGHTVVASGLVAGPSGEFIERGLRAMGIETAFMRVPGESRTCLTLIERASGTISELLETSDIEVSHTDAARFLAYARELARDADAVVVSGSLPAQLPRDYYRQLLSALRPLPVRLVFDSSGEEQRLGLLARPDLIKPNVTEMGMLTGQTLSSLEDMIAFAQQQLLGPVLPAGAKVLLSLGAQGAALITRTSAHIGNAPPIAVVNPVGAGDAMLAGFLDAEGAHMDNPAALRQALATGSAATLQETAGVVKREDIERLLDAIHVRNPNTPGHTIAPGMP